MKYNGRVLLCYGLNNTKVVLNDLKEFFEEHHYDVHILELQGHFPGSKNIFDVTVDDWIKDFYSSWKECITLCEEDQLPFTIVGYSVSAMVIESALASTNLPDRDRISYLRGIIYFAPAFKIRWHIIAAIRILSTLRIKKVKSLAPKEIRANNELPIKLYMEILKNMLLISNYFNVNNFKKLIFYAKNDEIIALQNISNKNIKYIVLDQRKLKQKHQHLVIVKTKNTISNWENIQQATSNFIRLK